jgi:SAM-dependent methyltransferase
LKDTATLAAIKTRIPEPVKIRLKRLMPWRYPVYCPICRTRHETMWTFRRRPNATCPTCGSLERHRLLWLFLVRHMGLLSGTPTRLLHVAPEPILADRFSHLPGTTYVSTDLAPDRHPSVLNNMERLGFGDASFDLLVCSHVLEHVPDDRAAMRECHRVLRPGGALIVMVPLSQAPTDEDLTVVDPGERERRFGQFDHVRFYGPDIAGRLQDAGFAVSLFGPDRVLKQSDGDIGVTPAEPPVILCRRR